MREIDETIARSIAERVLDQKVRPGLVEEIVITTARAVRGCWIVGYNTQAYVETGLITHALAGGGPVIINRFSGEAKLGTSALPIEDQLEDC
jgi:hypothetical protein